MCTSSAIDYYYDTKNRPIINGHITDKKAALSQGGPRDAAVNFDTYRILQRHRAVSLPRHGFLVGLCLQTVVNYL